MQVGNLIAFMTYAMQIIMSCMILSMIFAFAPRAQASAVRINEVLDTKNSVVDQMKPLEIGDAPAEVQFDNVSYRYKGAEIPALTDIDFKATPGQIVGIIGGTGSGKSTLINLVSRVYDATTGAVQLDGKDVKSLSLSDINRHVSLAPQESLLFSGNLRDNLNYGKPDATDEELWRALKIAQADDFIKDDEGLDTKVEQGGDNFSGGQKQRLSIARALVKDASVYIFDDSFSALDFKTDASLRKALRNDPKMQQKVVMIVGQRISTIADSDQIIVLDKGKMVGLGTHQQLKANNKVYQEIIASQIKEADK